MQRGVIPESAQVLNQQIALIAPALERRGVETDDLRGRAGFIQRALSFRFWGRHGQPHPRDCAYSEYNTNYVLDLVSVIRHGDSVNTFHWRDGPGSVGMLSSLELLLDNNYGASAEPHKRKLQQIARAGAPQTWAFAWVLFLAVDAGLQRYVCSDAVRDYIGTDGRRKNPVDPRALQCYLTSVRTAMRNFAVDGMRECSRVTDAVLAWHVYGGRRLPL